MGYFGKRGITAQTDVVEIKGGYKVVIGRLNGEQEDACEAILRAGKTTETVVVARANGEVEQETRLPMEFAAYREAFLLRAIRSWDLTDDDDQVVPITLENIKALEGDDRNKVFLAAKAFAKGLSEQQKGE